MIVTITKVLEDWWATPDQWRTMSDVDVIELLQEDLLGLLDDAEWSIVRHSNETYKESST